MDRPGVAGARDVGRDPGNGSASAVLVGRRLVRRYGSLAAVDDVSLEVLRGEILALLGPSGCGKTTMLRLLAGFERPDAGVVELEGRLVAGPGVFVEPERRRVGMVFQDHALFPHLSVAGNIAFGLSRRSPGTPGRVESLLELVGLPGLGERRPHELSGGQRQRVALARALAPRPPVILLDEPFTGLDPTLRAEVRAEVAGILGAAGATAVVVTHDQEEALSLAGRVAVMRAGRLIQVDAPDRLYHRPADRFVATFVGHADLVAGVAEGPRAHTPFGSLRLAEPVGPGPVEVVLRPEAIRLRLDGAGQGLIVRSSYVGHDRLVEVAVARVGTLRSRVGPQRHFEPGDRVSVSVEGDVVAFPAVSTGPATPLKADDRRLDPPGEALLG